MFQISDATASAQRIAIDNSGNTEFGGGTPTAPLSFAGRVMLNGSNLAQSVAAPPSMQRVTGSVTVSGPGTPTRVNLSGAAGFGSIDGNGKIYNFDSSGFDVLTSNSGTTTLGYAVF